MLRNREARGDERNDMARGNRRGGASRDSGGSPNCAIGAHSLECRYSDRLEKRRNAAVQDRIARNASEHGSARESGSFEFQ